MQHTQMIALGKSFLLWFGLQMLAKAKKGARKYFTNTSPLHTENKKILYFQRAFCSITIDMASVFCTLSKPFSPITFWGNETTCQQIFIAFSFVLFVWDVSTDKWLAFHYHTSVSNTMGSILSQTEKAYIKEILPLSSSFRTIQTKWIQDICQCIHLRVQFS